MVVINRTRKVIKTAVRMHTCVTALDRQSRCSQAQRTPVVQWDNHALRLNAHQLC